MSAPSAVPTRTFDYGLLTVVWKGITAHIGSESVKVSYDEDFFTLHAAADGTQTRAVNNNRAGKITITLPQNSPTHDLLTAQAKIDRATGAGIGAIEVKDGSGRSIHSAPDAWIVKIPDAEYQKDVTTREWVFQCGTLTSDVNGLN